LHNAAVGRSSGVARMTVDLDAANYITTHDDFSGELTEVPMVALDDAIGVNEPTLVKIDVEGYETEVIVGAEQTLRRQSLLAVIIETNDCAIRYGADLQSLDEIMLLYGFERSIYDPMTRALRPRAIAGAPGGRNTLYVRNPALVRTRLIEAAPFHVIGRSL